MGSDQEVSFSAVRAYPTAPDRPDSSASRAVSVRARRRTRPGSALRVVISQFSTPAGVGRTNSRTKPVIAVCQAVPEGEESRRIANRSINNCVHGVSSFGCGKRGGVPGTIRPDMTRILDTSPPPCARICPHLFIDIAAPKPQLLHRTPTSVAARCPLARG